MPQTKIYGYATFIQANRQTISDTIHACVVEALAFPVEKRFHRFMPMLPEDLIVPSDRTEKYLVIEISLFAGRSIEAKKQLMRLLYAKFDQVLNIGVNDIEIILYEVPRHDWAVRGMPGDELSLSYPVTV
jgi:phenylpyruvate tautomerase PptA (4-oxalocrotonate tautomerase family)